MFVVIPDLDLGAWRTALGALPAALDDALEDAVREAGDLVVVHAKADHPYQDRTGRLTRSIRAYAPRGRFTRGTLRGEVVATAPYASYLEDGTTKIRGFAYLAPAATRMDGRMAQALEDALEAAVRRAGLG